MIKRKLIFVVFFIFSYGHVQSIFAQTVSCPTEYKEAKRTSTLLRCEAEDDGSVTIDYGGICTAANGSHTKLALGSIIQHTCLFKLTPSSTPRPAAIFSEWIDNNQIEACNSNCIERVQQTRRCLSGNNCSGPRERVVERSCDRGEGFCKVDGSIINNSNFELGSFEYSTGTALENVCPQLSLTVGSLTPAQRDLHQRCLDLIREDDDLRQVQGVQNLSAEEFTSFGTNFIQLNRFYIGNITRRLAALRPAIEESADDVALNVGSLRTSALLSDRQSQREQGGAAGDNEFADDTKRTGVFINGVYGAGDKDETARSSGFDHDSNVYTIGVDYLLDHTTIIGAALGYGTSTNDFNQAGGYLDVDTVSVSLYGSKYINDSWFIDGVIGYGKSDYDSRRNLSYTANGVRVDQSAIGETDGDQILFSLGVGKSWSRGVEWDLSGRVNYLTGDVDRFTETINNTAGPGFGLALEIDDQDYTSVTSDINLRISKAFSQNFGVLVPSLSLSWLHEFEENNDSLRARFINDPFSIDFTQSGISGVTDGAAPTIFEVPLDNNDSNYGQLTLGLNVLFPNDVTLYLNANTFLGLEDIDYQFYSIGLRKDF